MQIAPVFAVLLVLGVVGFLLNLSLRLIEKRTCFWAYRVPDGGGI
jgi:ABC-type nitrate/sulfonate/bicarbonate transport system permease component